MSPCLSVREGYDRWAPIYDRTPNPVLALEERHLEHMLPDLVGKTVLDLACGTGRWIPRLLSRGAHSVVGVDLSEAMLRVTRNKAGIRDRVVLGECTQLPFRAGIFDFILCSFALNHIPRLKMLAAEFARTLKGDGCVLISEMHPDAYARGWRPGFRDEQSAAQIETVHHSTEEVIESFGATGIAFIDDYDFSFGDAEFSIFVEAGKATFFEEACRSPAVKVYEFRNVHSGIAF